MIGSRASTTITYHRIRKGELVVVYGRRRIGKTTLIRKLLEKYDGVYLYVEGSDMRRFLTKAEKLLEHLFRKGRIIVLDEYQT